MPSVRQDTNLPQPSCRPIRYLCARALCCHLCCGQYEAMILIKTTRHESIALMTAQDASPAISRHVCSNREQVSAL